jgi:hypothetical protein
MSAWDDYLQAAQRLDVLRQEAASAVAARAAAVKAARSDLAGVRRRTELLRSRLVAAAREARVPHPAIEPTERELASVRDALGPSTTPAVVQGAIRNGDAVLAEADAALSTVDRRAGVLLRRISTWNIELRNLLVYVGFAVGAVVAPLLTLNAKPNTLLLVATIAGAVVLPVIGYVLALITVGMLYRPDYRGRVRRTPIAGAVATIATVIVLYTLYTVLAVTHIF